MRLGWMFAIAACGQTAPPPVTSRTTAEAPTAEVPATPEPTVRWSARTIVTQGLPAIARDGTSIVIAHRDNDSGRGNPNLTLIEKDRDDRDVSRLVVLTANEADTLAPPQIEARFKQAAVWLHERHAARHLVPMTALTTGLPTGNGPAPATGDGVTLRWTPNQLVLERGPITLVRRATPVTWLAPDYPMCRGCSEVCHNEAFLGGGNVDLARKVVLVIVAYRGTDICWEPSVQEHVVSW